MTLTDDNFASIVAAIEEGRGIFSNIKKYLMYLLSSNIGEIGLMAGATLAGLPLPLSAVQILYVNLATDGLPALAWQSIRRRTISCNVHRVSRAQDLHAPCRHAYADRWRMVNDGQSELIRVGFEFGSKHSGSYDNGVRLSGTDPVL